MKQFFVVRQLLSGPKATDRFGAGQCRKASAGNSVEHCFGRISCPIKQGIETWQDEQYILPWGFKRSILGTVETGDLHE
jgi:hypothetical protein